MLQVITSVNNLKGLEKHRKLVEKLLAIKNVSTYQTYIQEKVMETAKKVSEQLLVNGQTTNDDSIGEYISNHKIDNRKDGFILYNDTMVDAIVKDTRKYDALSHNSGYPNEKFPVALAFEYGVGIVGENTNNPNAWNYNLNGYNFGWYLPKEVANRYGINGEYGGYQGLEVYRHIAMEIEAQFPKWVNDYLKKYGGVR